MSNDLEQEDAVYQSSSLLLSLLTKATEEYEFLVNSGVRKSKQCNGWAVKNCAVNILNVYLVEKFFVFQMIPDGA